MTSKDAHELEAYRAAQRETLARLATKVEEIIIEIAVIKARVALVAGFAGFIVSLATTVLVKVFVK